MLIRSLCSRAAADKLATFSEARLSVAANPGRARADLVLAACSLLWCAAFVVVKNALDYASVFIFLAARFSVVAVIQNVTSSSHRQRSLWIPAREHPTEPRNL